MAPLRASSNQNIISQMNPNVSDAVRFTLRFKRLHAKVSEASAWRHIRLRSFTELVP